MAKNNKKIYGLYLAWHQREVYGHYDSSMPEYPKQLAKVRYYDNKLAQLEAYANTPCPASQIFEADSVGEAKKIVEEFGKNFENQEWLEKNIYPYI